MKKFLLFLLTLAISSAKAQNQAEIDPSFKHEDQLPMFNLYTTQTITQPDGKIVILGPFDLQYKYNDLYANRLCSKIIRLNSDLTVDETFNSGLGFDSHHDYFDDVTCAELQADGKLLVGGKFVLYNGVTAHKIARLNPDGSRDNTFFSLNLFSSVNSFVQDIEIQPDHKILVAGYIESQFAMVRLNSDGTVDNSFNMSSNLPIIFADFHLMNDGKIVLVGSNPINAAGDFQQQVYVFNNNGNLASASNIFTAFNTRMNRTYLLNGNKIMLSVASGANNDYLMRINLDGTLDNTFNSGTGFSRSNEKAYLGDINFQTNGDMVITGNFTQYNGNPVRNRVRINSNGDFDPSFNNLMADNNDWLSYAKIQSDGRILACFFVYSPYDSIIRESFLWLDSNGYIIDNQHLNTTTKVEKFVRKSNNELMVMGSSDFSFNWYQNGIKLLDNNGNLIYNDKLKAPLNANYDPKNAVVQPDGKVLFIGKLPQNPSGRLMRFNADFSTDPSFNPDASLASMSFKELHLQADGKILVSCKGLVSGNEINRVVRLNSDGSIDTNFVLGQGVYSGGSPKIAAIEIQPDGKILIAGTFTSYNAVAKNGIVRLNSDGTIDNTFNMPIIDGFSRSVSALTLQADAKIIVALTYGAFAYRLNTNGSIDLSFSNQISGGFINTIAIQTDGKILIGGRFYHGNNLVSLLRYNSNGSLDTTFDTGTGFNETVNSIFIEEDGKILVGGQFTKYNGEDCNGLVRLNGTATLSIQESELDSDSAYVFPNPAHDELNISVKKNIQINAVTIYNIIGQRIISIANPKTNSNINIASLRAGHYFIKIDSNGSSVTKKFIKS